VQVESLDKETEIRKMKEEMRKIKEERWKETKEQKSK
jgi:hypothetical protein